jgi:hypothetical protein
MLVPILTKAAPVAVQLGFEGVKATLRAAAPIAVGVTGGLVAMTAGGKLFTKIGSLFTAAQMRMNEKKKSAPAAQ